MKIWKGKQLKLLEDYPKVVVNSINETMSILNYNYGTDRYVDKDLWVYIQVIEFLK